MPPHSTESRKSKLQSCVSMVFATVGIAPSVTRDGDIQCQRTARKSTHFLRRNAETAYSRMEAEG
jgi:hypothetical protein